MGARANLDKVEVARPALAAERAHVQAARADVVATARCAAQPRLEGAVGAARPLDVHLHGGGAESGGGEHGFDRAENERVLPGALELGDANAEQGDQRMRRSRSSASRLTGRTVCASRRWEALARASSVSSSGSGAPNDAE